jgi:hypothetical protein
MSRENRVVNKYFFIVYENFKRIFTKHFVCFSYTIIKLMLKLIRYIENILIYK